MSTPDEPQEGNFVLYEGDAGGICINCIQAIGVAVQPDRGVLATTLPGSPQEAPVGPPTGQETPILEEDLDECPYF